MYLPVSPQPDCASAWLEAAKMVDRETGREAHNVIVDVVNPTVGTSRNHPVVAAVADFLQDRDKSIYSVANTIFPEALYRRYGAPHFIDVFHQRVLPRIRRNRRWSGYYFERMTCYPVQDGEPMNLLWDIVERIRSAQFRSRNKFELPLFDPERDIDGSPYGGQCLSFLSFKLLRGADERLGLTAIYRNHYYTEKLLGNLIGLGRLMAFVAAEGGIGVGPLTVISTHAQIDTPRNTSRRDVETLLDNCSQALRALPPAA